MWIKKISYITNDSLKGYLISRFLFFLILNFSIFVASEPLENIIVSHHVEIQLKKDIKEIDQIINSIKNKIEKNNLTISESLNIKELSSLKNYKILFLNSKNFDLNSFELFTGVDLEYADLFTKKYHIQFKNEKGTLYIFPSNIQDIFGYYDIIILTTLFLILIIEMIFVLKKPLNYIKEIEQDINKISNGNFEHRIPLRYSNELTKLCQTVNEAAELILKTLENEKENEIKQRKLITNMSHDLRTPLTSIIGYLNLISLENKFTNEEKTKYISVALNNSYRLNSLIDELFYYSKLINTDLKLNFNIINIGLFLNQYITEEVSDLKINFDSKKIFLNLDIPQTQRILDNIFSNIRKYKSKDSEITIKIIKKNNMAKIIFENDTEENLKNKVHLLFERLYVSKEERNDSSGLGLAIVKEIVKILKGNVYIEYENKLFKLILEFPIVNL
ncbi:HAMP domain-containing sensor histidine kinase [Fusobacterium sp. IOR10]|uniref:HAMP domain-containing sensor histidine kinase n=1 Tax=Fusobacterium sp. IOR10 TaxID=2665157 RepID=UPI0013D09A47|nr:HAMP domain-containing sensor histidine kinase [Fusobacterium sp. IOR10]